jgi:hypothetical protein
MTVQGTPHNWVFKRKQVRVTTWRFRLIVLSAAALLVYLTHTVWLEAIGRSLIHEQDLEPADVLLLENFDTEYLVFEMGSTLLRSGYAERVLIPIIIPEKAAGVNLVEQGFVEVMCRVARIDKCRILPVRQTEPISLNAARQIADTLESEGLDSVIVVSPRFRSARSFLVYDSVFTPRGIRVQCQAASAVRTYNNWWKTWHGLQDIGLETAKLLYYRLWVL